MSWPGLGTCEKIPRPVAMSGQGRPQLLEGMAGLFLAECGPRSVFLQQRRDSNPSLSPYRILKVVLKISEELKSPRRV